jgi:hypothetical protein
MRVVRSLPEVARSSTFRIATCLAEEARAAEGAVEATAPGTNGQEIADETAVWPFDVSPECIAQ